jgi:mycothiol synthase
VLIRPFLPSDSITLAQCRNVAFPAEQLTPKAFEHLLESVHDFQGQSWVIEANGHPVGYATATPVPGLDNVFDLQGCIDPARRRRGLGSRLLQHVLEALRRRGARQVSRAAESPDDPAARFLLKRGFFIEHVEARMHQDRLDELEASAIPPGFHLQSFHKSKAIEHFLRLYEIAFGGHPWHQPYQGKGEVAAELADAADLLFLCKGQEPIGFLWMRWPAIDVAEIEPLGIAPAYQGRGLARPFLLAGMLHAADQGATKVTLGIWENNKVAMQLYRSLGFRRTRTVTYLAFDFLQD